MGKRLFIYLEWKLMTDLTKRESAYFIASAIAGLGILIGILAFWASTQPKCWDTYTTEVQAIEMCEQ
jgi:hypothetical protein